jgi:SpoVK/Ycf46/Vps4 family AAA+-type ATPase
MRKMFLSLLFIISSIMSSSCAAMTPVAAPVPQGYLSSMTRLGRSVLSYVTQRAQSVFSSMSQQKQWIGKQGQALLAALGRARCTGLSGASKIAGVPLAFLSRHKKSIVLTLAASGIVYGAGKLYHFMRTENSQDREDGQAHGPATDDATAQADPGDGVSDGVPETEEDGAHAAAATPTQTPKAQKGPEQTDDFMAAVREWTDAEYAYEQQVSHVKSYVAFLLPAAVGTMVYDGLRARHQVWQDATEKGLIYASWSAGLMYNLFNVPLDLGVRGLSYVPCPHMINSLRDLRIKAKNAWQNLERIVRDQHMSTDDLERIERDSHMQLHPDVRTKLRDYIQTLPAAQSHDQEGGRAKQRRYVGAPPKEVKMLIRRLNTENSKRPLPRSILLLGKPGTGKTQAARYVERATGCKMECLSAAEFITKWQGDPAQNIKAAYDRAASAAKKSGRPAIVFIDEADVILGKRAGQDSGNGYDEVNRLMHGMLLPILDGVKTPKNVVTIFASNMDYNFFDPAVVRPGRITYKIYLQLPDEVACKALLKEAVRENRTQVGWLAQEAYAENLADLARLVHEHGFSADEIFALIESAVALAIDEEQDIVEEASIARNGGAQALDEDEAPGDSAARAALYREMEEVEDRAQVLPRHI